MLGMNDGIVMPHILNYFSTLVCYFSIFLQYCDGGIIVCWCGGRCAILLGVGGGQRQRSSSLSRWVVLPMLL